MAAPPFTPPAVPLQLDDYVRKAGYDYIILALFQAERVGDDIYDANAGEGEFRTGDQDFDAATVVNRIIEESSGVNLSVRRTGTLDFETFFGAGQTYPMPRADIQTADGLCEYTFDVVHSANNVGFDSGTNASIVDAIADDTRFILAIYGQATMARGFGSGFGQGFG